MEALDFISETEDRQLLDQAIEKQGELLALQLLGDLGYVPFEYFGQQDQLEAMVRKNAIAQFREEYRTLLESPGHSNFSTIYNQALTFDHETLTGQLSEREEFLLTQVTGLENEFELVTIPVGQTSLLSRVFFYRFRTYDLTGLLASNTYSEDIASEIRSIVSGISYDGSTIDFANMLADQSALSDFILSSERLRPELYKSTIFFSVQRDVGRELLREFGRPVLRDDNAFLGVIDNLPEQGEVKNLIRPSQRDRVDVLIEQNENQFLLRVLQVKLWVLGLYEGHLDTDFGGKTFLALKELLEHLHDNSESDEEVSKLLHSIRKQHWAFNMEYFLKAHLAPLEGTEIDGEESSSISQVYQFILNENHEVTTLSSNDREEVENGKEQVTNSLKTGIKTHAQNIVSGNRSERRRQYQGKKGIIGLAQKFFGWIKAGVRFLLNLIKKVLKLITKTLKSIFNEIREAIIAFKNGIGFLFGKRIVTTGGITTDYDFDFDGITTLTGDISKQDMQEHASKLQLYSTSVYKALNFTKVVIKWGIDFAQGPVGWIKIAIGIAKLFKQMIVERIKAQSISSLAT